MEARRPGRRSRRGRRRDERGASVIVMAIVMVLLLLVAAFAVDIGMQRVGRSDMQSLADVVALDLARELDGTRTVAQLEAVEQTLADQSRDRNRDVIGFAEHLPTMSVDWGEMQNGEFVALSGAAVPTAVKVTADTVVGFAFGGITGVDSGGANRHAVATADKSACYRLGSFVASLDSSESALLNPILNALLGSSLNLNAVGYQGLANANVDLADLVEVGGLGVGSVDELLALNQVSLHDLFLASANVLDRQGNGAQADILRSLAVQVGTPTIAIADLIDAAPSDQAALGASLNVLDLVTGAAFVANENHAVDIPNLGITLPGVASVTTSLTVIETPRTACGPIGTTNRTAQVKLDLTAHVNQQTLNVATLGTSFTINPIDFKLSFDLGKAMAELTDVVCTNGSPSSLKVRLRSALLGALNLTASIGVSGRVDPLGGSSLLTDILNLLSLGSLLKPPYLTLDTSLNLYAGAPTATTYDKTVTVPIPGGYTTPAGAGSGDLLQTVSLTPQVNTDVVLHYYELLGGWKERHLTDPLNTVFQDVVSPLTSSLLNSVVNPLIQSLQDQLVKPLEKLLGLQLAGADVFAVPTPTCGLPKLVE